ncbi:hypothetical protein ACIQZI_13160 [Peribacillus sp. NPDC096379]
MVENRYSGNITDLFEVTSGKLTYTGPGSYGPYIYQWTFSATSYEDVLL